MGVGPAGKRRQPDQRPRQPGPLPNPPRTNATADAAINAQPDGDPMRAGAFSRRDPALPPTTRRQAWPGPSPAPIHRRSSGDGALPPRPAMVLPTAVLAGAAVGTCRGSGSPQQAAPGGFANASSRRWSVGCDAHPLDPRKDGRHGLDPRSRRPAGLRHRRVGRLLPRQGRLRARPRHRNEPMHVVQLRRAARAARSSSGTCPRSARWRPARCAACSSSSPTRGPPPGAPRPRRRVSDIMVVRPGRRRHVLRLRRPGRQHWAVQEIKARADKPLIPVDYRSRFGEGGRALSRSRGRRDLGDHALGHCVIAAADAGRHLAPELDRSPFVEQPDPERHAAPVLDRATDPRSGRRARSTLIPFPHSFTHFSIPSPNNPKTERPVPLSFPDLTTSTSSPINTPPPTPPPHPLIPNPFLTSTHMLVPPEPSGHTTSHHTSTAK